MNKQLFSRHWFEFIRVMTVKEIKARYKKAVLGFLWIIINPIIQMVVMGIIFQFFVPVKVNNYFLFLFVGLLPWNFFSYTIVKNTPMILNERALIKKAKFPREGIILSVVLSNVFHMLIAWVLLLSILIADKLFIKHFNIVEILSYCFRMAATFPVILWLTVLTTGLSLFFATINVKYRDTNFFVQALIPIWFYLTPIVYDLRLLPPQFAQLLHLNPVTGVIELLHGLLLNQPIYNPLFVFFDFLLSIGILLIGWIIFVKESPYFDDWI